MAAGLILALCVIRQSPISNLSTTVDCDMIWYWGPLTDRRPSTIFFIQMEIKSVGSERRQIISCVFCNRTCRSKKFALLLLEWMVAVRLMIDAEVEEVSLRSAEVCGWMLDELRWWGLGLWV